MKRIFTILICFIAFKLSAQTYNPALATVTNKPLGLAQGFPTDARSWYYDPVNFLWRPYQSTAEVLSYLNLPKYRAGNFIIVVDSGGTLQSNGTYSPAGHATFWEFKDSTANANLVELNLFGQGGTISNLTATSTNGINFTITNPAGPTANIGLALAFGGDISGNVNAITVNNLAGRPPSYYLNYLNLINTPVIPAQFNPTAGPGMSLSGSYPNITFTNTILSPVAGTYILVTGGGNNVINLDTLHYRKVDTLIGVNDSTLNYTLNGNLYSITLRGGAHGGGGGGGSVLSVAGTNANGVSWTITNPTSNVNLSIALGAITPTTVNGLTHQANSVGFSIWGGTTPDTLTVIGKSILSGTNSGDITIAGQNYLSLTNQVLTANPVNVSGANITGILKAASFPALTGPVSNSAGSLTTQINLGNDSIYIGNGSSIAAEQIVSGDITMTNTGVVTIGNNKVSYAKMQQGSGHILLGVPGASTANLSEITLGLGLKFSGTTVLIDTSLIQYKTPDSVFVKQVGTGQRTGYATGTDTLNLKAITNAQTNSDSSLTIIPNDYDVVMHSSSTTNNATATTHGYLPILSNVATQFLNGTGAWSTPNTGILSIGTFDAQAPAVVGGSIVANVLYFQSAQPGYPGMWSNGTQTLAGNKTLSGLETFDTTLFIPGTHNNNGCTSCQVVIDDTLTHKVWTSTYFPLDTTGFYLGHTDLQFATTKVTLGVSGGGSGLTRQVFTTGSQTIGGSNYWVDIDPPTTITTASFTMPISPVDLQFVYISFGGTITSGTVISNLSILPNSGQTILDNTPPTTATADNILIYEYRASNTQWKRFKP